MLVKVAPLVLILGLLSACDALADRSDQLTPTAVRLCAPVLPGASSTPDVFCADPSPMLAAPVVRVVDGDTIRVIIDGIEEPVRFYGIDTPERGEPCFEAATERTRKLVGSEVRLKPDARNRDRNARLLRYVYQPSGLSVDAMLISEGLARAWTDDGVLREALVALELAARAQGVGCLWSPE